MKTVSLYLKTGAAILLALNILPQTTEAIPGGTISGVFVNAVGGDSVGAGTYESETETLIDGTPSFQWGTSASIVSSLDYFSPDGGPPFLPVDPLDSFSVGELTYVNGSILPSSTSSFVSLLLSFTFRDVLGNPLILPAAKNFVFEFSLVNTPNTTVGTEDEVNRGDADYVLIVNPESTGDALIVDGQAYQLQLSFGEIDGGGLSDGFLGDNPNEFHVIEDGSATVEVKGMFVPVPTGGTTVPDCGATGGLLFIGLGLMEFTRRLLRRN